MATGQVFGLPLSNQRDAFARFSVSMSIRIVPNTAASNTSMREVSFIF